MHIFASDYISRVALFSGLTFIEEMQAKHVI